MVKSGFNRVMKFWGVPPGISWRPSGLNRDGENSERSTGGVMKWVGNMDDDSEEMQCQ